MAKVQRPVCNGSHLYDRPPRKKGRLRTKSADRPMTSRRIPVLLFIVLGILSLQLLGCGGSGSSSYSLSSTESEANSTAIEAWAALLDAHQGTSQNFLNTSITSCAPSKLGEELDKGNTITLTWESLNSEKYSGCYRTAGDVQIKDFWCQVTAQTLTPADSANGISWQGTVSFAFVMRYRGALSKGDYFCSSSPAEIRPLSDQQPFSSWTDVGSVVETNGKKVIAYSPASFLVVKQNGKWSAPTFNPLLSPLSTFSQTSIICPLPGIPYSNYYTFGWGTQPYVVIQTATDQTAPVAGSTDDEFIAQARQAAQGKAQPGDYSSCLVYAQHRGLPATAGGNTGAFNILYQGNDAKLVSNSPTAQLKPEIDPLQGVTDLTTVLHPGDFIVWQRGVSGVDQVYGHIAVIELVDAGRVAISQANWSPAWKVLRPSDFVVAGIYAYPKDLP